MRVKLLLFFLAVFSCLFFISPFFVLAQVVINEFCPDCDPEWVELFNLGSEQVDLEGWEIQDDNKISSDDLTITQAIYTSTIIPAQGFMVFQQPEGKGWLNNSGDTVKLFDNKAQLIDSYQYSSSTDNKTYSRIPDGSGDFVANTDPTFNQANQAPSTPTPTPTSTPTTTSTSTPTPTPAPSKIQAPSSTYVPTPTISKKVLATTTTITTPTESSQSSPSGLVLSESSTPSSQASSTSSVSKSLSSSSPSRMPRLLMFLGGGLSLTSLALWGRRQLRIFRSE